MPNGKELPLPGGRNPRILEGNGSPWNLWETPSRMKDFSPACLYIPQVFMKNLTMRIVNSGCSGTLSTPCKGNPTRLPICTWRILWYILLEMHCTKVMHHLLEVIWWCLAVASHARLALYTGKVSRYKKCVRVPRILKQGTLWQTLTLQCTFLIN